MAGNWNPETGEYTPTPEEVHDSMRRWGTPAGEERKVYYWLKQLAENRWYATAVYFPYVWQNVMGIYLCISTAESTRQCKANADVENQRRMRGIQIPEWMQFDVYFYPGLVFGNLFGFTNPAAEPLGTLGNVLNRLFTNAGILDWRRHVNVAPGGWVYAGLRRLLQLLGIPVHAEVVSGISYRRMASLDVFVATHLGAMGIEPQPMMRWNVCHEVQDGIVQYFPKQDHWWHMPVWRPEGQYEHGNIMDYQVDLSMPPQLQDVLETYEGLARVADAPTRNRIVTMLGHIAPPVLPHGLQLTALRELMAEHRILPAADRPRLEDDERRDGTAGRRNRL